MPLGAAIAGLGSIASGLVNSFTARENTDKANKANRELAQYAYSKDLEMWNRGNAYNDPSAQMDRLKRAGLNPNLVYGSGAAAGNTASQLPKYNAPTMSYNYRPPVDPLQMLGAYNDFRLQQAQIKATEAEAEVKHRTIGDQSEILSNKRIMYGQQVDRNATEIGWMNSAPDESSKNKYGVLKDTQTAFMKEGNRLREEQIANLGAQRGKILLDTDYRQKELDNFLTKMWAGIITQGVGKLYKPR